MKSEIKFVPLEAKHASIVPYLRQVDIDENNAMTGLSPDVAVAFSIAHTEKGFAVVYKENVVAIFGISEGGVIWLVGTDEITKHPVTFYRMSKKYFEILKTGYKRLFNYVDKRNYLTLKWLKWLGFKIEKEQYINNHLFHYVHWDNPSVDKSTSPLDRGD